MRTALLAATLLTASHLHACSWAIGSFHQVTGLKGKVVGMEKGAFNWHWQWLRHRNARAGAKLELYEYQLPYQLDQKHLVAATTADQNGFFDFGKLKSGHYRLRVTSGSLDEIFDVEVIFSRPITKSILIDISPVFPDCSGGHEFLETTES